MTRTPAQQAREELITRLITSETPLNDPNLLIDRANQYRLGDNNNALRNLPQDVQTFIRSLTPAERGDISSNLYYQSARSNLLDRNQPMDGMLLVGRGGNPSARQLSEAFEQSFRGEGVVARRMVDDIARARSPEGLRAFIREAQNANFDELFTNVPANQGAKANLQDWANYIQSTYRNQLSPEDLSILQTFR